MYFVFICVFPGLSRPFLTAPPESKWDVFSQDVINQAKVSHGSPEFEVHIERRTEAEIDDLSVIGNYYL